MQSYNKNIDFDKMSNNDIRVKMKELEMDFNFIKNHIIKYCNELEKIEELHKNALIVLKNRGVE